MQKIGLREKHFYKFESNYDLIALQITQCVIYITTKFGTKSKK